METRSFEFVNLGDGYVLLLSYKSDEGWRWSGSIQGIAQRIDAEVFPDRTSAHDAGVGWASMHRYMARQPAEELICLEPLADRADPSAPQSTDRHPPQ
jgi:hypothetical protein